MVIEIVGMTITVPELIWTMINFVILYFLLKKLLFKPLMAHLDARNARINEGLAIGAGAEKELKNTKRLMEDEISRCSAEARGYLEEANREAEAKKEADLIEAKEESLRLREEIRQRILEEQAHERAELEERMPEFVELLSNRLLHSNEATGKTELINSCIEAAGNGTPS